MNYDPKKSDIFGESETITDNDKRFEDLITIGNTLFRASILFGRAHIEEFTVINARNLTTQKLLIVLRPKGRGADIVVKWKSIKFNYELSDFYSRKEDAIYILKEYLKKINDSIEDL